MRVIIRPELVGVLIIIVVCGDHKSHHFGTVCSSQTGPLNSTTELGNVVVWPPIEADAGFESDVNGQEQVGEQTEKNDQSLIDPVRLSAAKASNNDDGYELLRPKTNQDDSLAAIVRDFDQNEVHLDSDKNDDKRADFEVDPREMESSWCNVDAELDGHCRRLLAHNYSQALRVCGSDGEFYETICDFRRRSCIRAGDNYDHHRHLLRMESIPYCLAFESNAKNYCSRREFEQFRAALLSEYNQDVRSMFKHLDTNHNNLIEARELWPRPNRDDVDEELEKTKNCDDCYQLTHDKDAFEPHFDWSPCSLSHLLVYGNKSSFDLDQFFEVFAELQINKRGQTDTNEGNVKVSESFIETLRSKVVLGLGESKLTDCLPEGWQPTRSQTEPTCLWTRYGVDLGTIKDEHLSLARGELIENQRGGPLRMHLEDVQLYLSGPYKCSCTFSGYNSPPRTVQHQVDVQVLAQPRVSVRPKFQWSLPESRIAFECRHDFIDTNFESPNNISGGLASGPSKIDMPPSESVYRLRWSRDNHRQWIVDSKDYNDELNNDNNNKRATLAPSSSHASITAAASGRLVLERAQVNDTGRYYCLVEQFNSFNVQKTTTTTTSVNDSAKIISSNSNFGRLLIQDEPQSPLASAVSAASDAAIKYLWSFHENGISIYKLRTDDGQELELVRELAGQSLVSAEVDGNWNQLTLCGGFNPDQVVSCEWSDNALVVEVPNNVRRPIRVDDTKDELTREWNPNGAHQPDKYIYAGQPNLNRVIVMDAGAQEIVAIINTDPQPRKLFSFKPNKIHLSKWVRRRLSPLANARWLKAIDEQQTAQQQQSRAHPLKLTPKSSRLYSDKRQAEEDGVRLRRRSPATTTTSQLLERRSITPPKLVQHDIWLLCYGRPLVVDSAQQRDSSGPLANMHGLSREPSSSTSWWSSSSSSLHGIENTLDDDDGQNNSPPFTPSLVATWPLIGPHWAPPSSRDSSSGPSPIALPYSANKEARLRNRKSVQIIQSTFFPALSNPAMHHHNKQRIDLLHPSNSPGTSRVVAKFKRLTVLTTHHVIANRGMSSSSQDEPPYLGPKTAGRKMRLPQFDLVQSLTVPQVPYSQEMNPKFKLHHAYVTHYDERQLYRIAMDSYRYDMEIDLRNCDPLNLVSASLGLIIVQCRSPITHKLIGQLVLDELSSQIVQFKDNIRAQESCLTPDNRYLISIHTNQSSTIYVQSVKVNGLSLLYEIKTTLETTRCSFVWRDGYYSAIFVALNRRDKQSELLSLRLADSRLELIVRVPGLMTSSLRHKEPLNVEPELQIVTLSTDSGVHIIDLEENRIIQTIDHYHQRTSPTLLWV